MTADKSTDQIVIWDAARPGQRLEWEYFWQEWPRREVHGHPGYVSLFANSSSRALCAAWRTERGGILFPFLLRSLAAEPFCPPANVNDTDLATPYGYGGPYGWNLVAGDVESFWSAFTHWARAEHVVSEFLRLSVFQESLVPYPGDVEVQQPNVVRELDLSEAALWADVEQKVRKNVNRARASGVLIERDASGRRIDAFRAIYESTMKRRGAGRNYYFPQSFFHEIHASLPGQFLYFHAMVRDVVVSTELVLVSADTVYSFLGGTDDSAFELRPNDLLKYEIILWARREHKHAFVLGGGYTAGDGIFKYKKSFAPDGVRPFCVGRRVLNQSAYDALIRSRQAYARRIDQRWLPQANYFPAYRADGCDLAP